MRAENEKGLPMTLHDRRAAILSALARSGDVGIAELASSLSVSEMTIRRDLELLENKGRLRRVRGGAISTVSRSYEPTFALRQGHARDEKAAIGRAAAALLADGETAILDVGTTTLEIARSLHGRRHITVVTPSIAIAAELGNEPEMRILVTGGVLRSGELSLVGAAAESTFKRLNCDVVFLGVAGVDAEKGLTEYNLDDASVKQAALVAARRCIVVADSSKLGRVALANIAPLTGIDVLVTDALPDHPSVAAIVAAGVELVHVSGHQVAVEVAS